MVANVIGGVYSLLVLFLPQKSMLWRLVVALDVVIENPPLLMHLGFASLEKEFDEWGVVLWV